MPFKTTTNEIESEWEARHGTEWCKPKGRENDPEILLRQIGPNSFQLLDGFQYELPNQYRKRGETFRWDVPPHKPDEPPDAPRLDNSTDLCSVPAWLWWFIANHGRQTRAGLLHDCLIENKPKASDREADRAFRVALLESDVPLIRSWIMWTAVSLASTARARSKWFVLVFFGVPLVAFFLSLFYWWLARYSWWPLGRMFSGGNWWPLDNRLWAAGTGEPLWGNAWLLPLTIGLLGFFWKARWLFGIVGFALIALPTIAVHISYAVAFLIDWIGTLAYRVYARRRRLDLHIPNPSFGKPYRREASRF